MTEQEPPSQAFKYNIGQKITTSKKTGSKYYRPYELKVLGGIVLVFKTTAIGYGWKGKGCSSFKKQSLMELIDIIQNSMDENDTFKLCKDAENNLTWTYIKRTALTERTLHRKTLLSHFNALHGTHQEKWKEDVECKLRDLREAITTAFGQTDSNSNTVSGQKRIRSPTPTTNSDTQQESPSATVSKPPSKRRRKDGNSNTNESRREEESHRETHEESHPETHRKSQQQRNDDNSSNQRNADSFPDEEEEAPNGPDDEMGTESKVNYGAQIRKLIRTVPLLRQTTDKGAFICHEYFSWQIAVHMLDHWDEVTKRIVELKPEKDYDFEFEKGRIEKLKKNCM